MGEDMPNSNESLDTPQSEVPNPSSSTPEKAPEDKSFYTPEGWIANPNDAYDLAYTEKNLGVDAARRQEEALRVQSETGMTEEERINTEVMDRLLEKYPDAFETMILEDGTKAMVIRGCEDEESEEVRSRVLRDPRASIAFSKDGVLFYQRVAGGSSSAISADELTEISRFPVVMIPPSGKSRESWIFFEQNFPESIDKQIVLTSYCRGGLHEIAKNHPGFMENLKEVLWFAQRDGKYLESVAKEKERVLSVDEIMGMLE